MARDGGAVIIAELEGSTGRKRMLCHVLAEEGARTWLAFRRPVASVNGLRKG